jgi:hypothetical protein
VAWAVAVAAAGESATGTPFLFNKALPLTKSIPAPIQIVTANATNNAEYCFFMFLVSPCNVW